MTRNNSRNRANLGLDEAVEQINERLKGAGIKVRVRLNGKVLGLRATLPEKIGIGRKQQDIRMGVPGTQDGLRQIESKAHELSRQLIAGTFRWADWERNPASKPEEMTTADLIAAFKQEYFSSNRLTEPTWKATWQATLKRLPQAEPLTEANILAVILSTQNHTRLREVTVQRLQRLADYAGLQTDLKRYKGEYSEQSTEPRDIPSDAQIEEWIELIPNPQWRWVYGMIATFGLRPHEAFNCEFIDNVTLRVTHQTKTGSRIVRAILPDWVSRWNLQKVDRPGINARNPRDYGQRCSRQFSRYDLPIVPYDLRHAFAIRGSVEKGLPISTMAAMMGHSVAVHTKIYHRWLTDATNAAVYRRLVLGESSPR